MISAKVSTTLIESAWLEIEETNQHDRVLTFENLTDEILTVKVQHYNGEWIDQIEAFNIAPGAIVYKQVDAEYTLRIVGLGKEAERGLRVGYQRVYFRANFKDL